MADINHVYVQGELFDIADLIARQSSAALEQQKGEPDGIAPLNDEGVLDVTHGGTGASNPKAAQYNLLSNIDSDADAVADDTSVVVALASPTPSVGALVKKSALKLYNYILSKLPIGESNGIASLDDTGKVPFSQLPEAAMTFEGKANPSTPTPENPVKGMFWIVETAGTILGVADCAVDDRVIYDGTNFVKLPSGAVQSVNGKTGVVTLTAKDVGAVVASWNATSNTLTLEV